MSKPLELLEVNDIAVFAMLNNPVRLRILRYLDQPATVRQLAGWMGVPQTRLYYHVNLLHRAGVIKVVETRKVGALTEKLYQAAARAFRPGKGLLAGGLPPNEVAAVAVDAVLNGARLDAQAGVTAQLTMLAAGGDPEADPIGTLTRSIVRLSDAGRAEVMAKLRELLELVDRLDAAEGGTEYGLTYSLFPLTGPLP